MKVYEIFGPDITPQLRDAKEFIAGMECEIESVRSVKDIAGFNCTNDGSLRNNGVEFISPPLRYGELITRFSELQATLQFYNRDEAFSERTSTHVHINCASLEAAEVENLILIYALFEEIFFSVVKRERRNNIHCVPLTETYLPSVYRQNLGYKHGKWHKYTALNIRPLDKLGTVEFRHLEGTGDIAKVTEWLTILHNLWEQCQVTKVDAAFLQDERKIHDLYVRIFGHSGAAMSVSNHLMSVISNNLLDVKLSFCKG